MRSLRQHFALLLVLIAIPAFAQTSRGTVSGLVMDPQQLGVPTAAVELTSNQTGVVRSSVTNEVGLYRFDAVDPGDYELSVRRAGFKVFRATSLHVGAAELTTLDVALEIGEVQQVIEVVTSPVAVQTAAAVRGGNIRAEDILDLPYASRNPAFLTLTLPGVVSSRFLFSGATNSLSVNGTRGRSNNFMIDGSDNNDISVTGQAFEVRNPSSVQEVSVGTINYDAEFGRAGGAVINVITKSGTNQLHGTAGFVLDSTWDDAISSSLAPVPAIRARGHNLPGTEQQFDGTLGGPIQRNRTFFFLSYLELRQFSTSTAQTVSPTAAGRATLLRLFPPGANANADLLQAITAGYDGTFQTFNTPLGGGRPDIQFGQAITPYSQRLRIRQYGAKIDHRLGDKDTLAGRLLIDSELRPQGGEALSFPSFFTSETLSATSLSVYHTHIFSPTMTNELRPGYTRFNDNYPLDPQSALGTAIPQIAIAGINTLTQSVYGVRSNFPQGRLFNNYMLQDTMSIVRGEHTYRFGVDLMDQRARQAAPFNSRGQLSYGGSSGAGLPTFSGLANFLDNFGGSGGSAARTFGSATYYPSLFRQAYFFEDRWRATPNLTASLGLRYEYFGTPMNVIFNPVYTGLFNVDPVTLDSPLVHPSSVDPDRNNWSPTVGLAYSPSADSGLPGWLLGNHKASLRVGYGLGYDSYFNNITSNMVAGAPASLANSLPSTVTTANQRGVAGLSTLLPTRPPALTPFLSQTSASKNLVNPYYQRWSATLQRELPSHILLDMAYVGTKGTKLFVTEDGNPLVTPDLRAPLPANLSPAATPQARVDPLQGTRTVRTNGGASTYNAAQFEVTRRFARGFAASGSYTFSKLIDNGSEIFTLGGTATLQNASVPAMFGGSHIDKGLSFYDRTHRLVFTYSYELPFLKSQSGPLGRFLGGWQIVGLTTYESGFPYSVLDGQDVDGLGGPNYDRPNLNPLGQPGVRAVPNATSPTGYVNPDKGNAPIDPQQARYIGIANNTGNTRRPPGNLGRNTERGPGLKNWDASIIKNTRISERFNLEFRTEFFNVFNTPMYGRVSVSPFAPAQGNQLISANVFNSPAGQFLNANVLDGGGRVIRWQLRLRF
jgi:outer membrane receptor protein involved in Fe transport